MPAHSIHVSIGFIFSIHMSFTKNRNWIACVNSAEVLLLAKEKMQGIKIACFHSCLPFSECSQWCGSKDSTVSALTLTPTHKLKFWLFWIWRGRDFSPQIIWWRKSLTVSWVLITYGIKLTTKISLHNILFFYLLFLRQILTHCVALGSLSPCLLFLNTGITGRNHHKCWTGNSQLKGLLGERALTSPK